jgi:hypothetical protein
VERREWVFDFDQERKEGWSLYEKGKGAEGVIELE